MEVSLYSEAEYYRIDNPTVPQRELYLRRFNEITQTINMYLNKIHLWKILN